MTKFILYHSRLFVWEMFAIYKAVKQSGQHTCNNSTKISWVRMLPFISFIYNVYTRTYNYFIIILLHGL